jgi:hypothetical protein
MVFYIGVATFVVFLCWVIYFQHTTEFGQGRKRKSKEIKQG